MSEIVSAAVSGVVAIVVAVMASRWDTRRQTATLKHEVELETLRLREQLRTEYMAESAIHELLVRAEPKRSFDRIRARVGGFDEDELRRLLVRAGALRYEGRGGDELWGLRVRNEL
jgi:hypothetical protein